MKRKTSLLSAAFLSAVSAPVWAETALSDDAKNREIQQLKQELQQLKATVEKLENHLIHLQEGEMRKHPKAEEPGFCAGRPTRSDD